MAEFHTTLPAGLDDRLRAFADVGELPDLLFVCYGFDEGRTDGSSFDYLHGVATTRPRDELPGDLDVLEVPSGTWVVFDGGSDDGHLQRELQNLWANAYADWLPSNPYRVVPGPELLNVPVSDDDGNGRGELWLPVERSPAG